MTVAIVLGAALALAVLVLQRWHYVKRLRRAKLIRPKKEQVGELCRMRIADVLAELDAYELEHAARQVQRLKHQQRHGGAREPKRPHGLYDPDQKRLFVLIRVRELYKRSGDRPPAQLEQFIREAVADEE